MNSVEELHKYKCVQRLSVCITILILLVSNDLIGQPERQVIKSEDERLAETYGFLVGQEIACDNAKQKFPELSSQIQYALVQFELSYPQANSKFQTIFTTKLGDQSQAFEQQLRKQIATALTPKSLLTESDVTILFEEVKRRAEGEIPSPILETILSVCYRDDPELEFSRGFTQTFKTVDHPKAKGVNWQIKLPLSWKANEGDRPNIVQKFISNYGDGKEMISIMVMDFPDNQVPTKQDIDEFLTEETHLSMIPKNGKLISYKDIYLDGTRSAMMESEMIVSRLDYEIRIRTLQFSTIQNNKMLFVQCGVYGLATQNRSLS